MTNKKHFNSLEDKKEEEKTNWWDVAMLVIVGIWVAYVVSRIIW